MEEEHGGFSKVPVRRRYEEAFFEEEDDEELVQHIVPEPTVMVKDKDKHEEGTLKDVARIPCQVPNCVLSFATANEYQTHYGRNHMHACSVCKKSFPSSHILEMHVLEVHDSLFALMAERKPMYQCFIENCDSKFMKREERQQHCLQVHKFANKFQYWKPNQETSQQRKEVIASGKKEAKRKVKMKTVKDLDKDNSQLLHAGIQDICMEDDGRKMANSNSSVPKHISFGRSTHRTFKNAYAAATTPRKVDQGKNEENAIDMTDLGQVLVHDAEIKEPNN